MSNLLANPDRPNAKTWTIMALMLAVLLGGLLLFTDGRTIAPNPATDPTVAPPACVLALEAADERDAIAAEHNALTRDHLKAEADLFRQLGRGDYTGLDAYAADARTMGDQLAHLTGRLIATDYHAQRDACLNAQAAAGTERDA